MLLRESGAEGFIVLSDENGSNPHRTRSAGRIGIGDGMSEVGWIQAADTAGAIARAVKDATGLRTVLHHHAAGFVETPDETKRLLDATDPDCLGLCLDTGHWAYGGGDPVEAVRTFGSRIWHVHFKDHDARVAAQIRDEEEGYFSAVQRGIFCELGQGEVDFAGVLKALHAIDYSGWIVVEQDVLPGMGTPLDSAVRNRHFLSRLGL
jgi:inosose dehydratase